jgi:hypothetical protein
LAQASIEATHLAILIQLFVVYIESGEIKHVLALYLLQQLSVVHLMLLYEMGQEQIDGIKLLSALYASMQLRLEVHL